MSLSAPALKSELVAQLRRLLEDELATLTASTRAAHEAATHAESKPENKYDTRALEASYLAGAQKERAGEVQGALNALNAMTVKAFTDETPIALGALVELEQDGGGRSCCFLVGVGAGYTLQAGELRVQTITTKSPLGQALGGKLVGDAVTVRTEQGKREYEIVGVS